MRDKRSHHLVGKVPLLRVAVLLDDEVVGGELVVVAAEVVEGHADVDERAGDAHAHLVLGRVALALHDPLSQRELVLVVAQLVEDLRLVGQRSCGCLARLVVRLVLVLAEDLVVGPQRLAEGPGLLQGCGGVERVVKRQAHHSQPTAASDVRARGEGPRDA